LADRRSILIVLGAIVITGILLGFAFGAGGPGLRSSTNTTGAGVPNPAAEFCTSENTTRYEIRGAPDGSRFGACILPDGTVCDEWEYYRGNCTAASTPGQAITDSAENFCLSRGFMYQTQTGLNGTEYAFCIFPNGYGCEAYDYYLGKCSETMAGPV
jgi:putative hemolysin